MDKMIYLAMSGASQTLLAQGQASNNLANANTTAFRADLSAARAQPVFGPGYGSRVYAMTERPGIDFSRAALQQTGNDLDVAINGEGWIAVQGSDGGEAYTRAGDLRVNSYGVLETGAGNPVLGDAGAITIPQAEKIEIGADGTISLRPMGQGPEVMAQIARIKLVKPALDLLDKGADGLFRMKDGGNALPDASVNLVSGTLENSNVNAVEEMVNMINLSRRFELQIKAMHTAEENDAAAVQMMRVA